LNSIIITDNDINNISNIKRDKDVILKTYGYSLRYKKTFNSIKEYIDYYIVDLYSFDHLVYKKLFNSQFDEKNINDIIKGIKNIYNYNKEKVIINIALTKYTLYTLKNTLKKIEELFPEITINIDFDEKNFDIADILNESIEAFNGKIITNLPFCYYTSSINKIKYLKKNNIENDKCSECYYSDKCYKTKGNVYPIIKEEISISVRTKYYDVFYNIFFKSFFKYYKEYIPNLNVYVDCNYKEHNEKDYIQYKELSKKYGFNIYFTEREKEDYFILPNHYTFMLWRSVKDFTNKVISFDDDIKFHSKGLFKVLSKALNDNEIIAQEHFGTLTNGKNTVKSCISSWIFGTNKKVSKKEFSNFDKNYCDGNDMIGFTINNKNNIYYFDDIVDNLYYDAKAITRYYKHLSSITYIKERDEFEYNYSILDNKIKEEIRKEYEDTT